MTIAKLHFLLLLLYIKGTHSQLQNVVLIQDVGASKFSFAINLVFEILNELPLTEYRVSMYSTNGFAQRFHEFTTRMCLVKKLSANPNRYINIWKTLKSSVQEITRWQYNEKNIIVLITDRVLPTLALNILRKAQESTENLGIYILYVGFKENFVYQNGGFLLISKRSIRQFLYYLPFLKADRQLCVCQSKDDCSPKTDECNRQCDCVNGKLVNCKRLRKEFSSMSLEERMLYINTVKEISSNKKYAKLYEDYIAIHFKYFTLGIHSTQQFLPWHRRYTLGFENLLRLIDCRVTIPLWNWAKHSSIVWNTSSTYHMWDKHGGFGGDGDENKSYCVTDGPFSFENWETTVLESKKEIVVGTCFGHLETITDGCVETSNLPEFSHCLRRRFNGNLPNISQVIDAVNNNGLEDFFKFEDILKREMHAHIHERVGGHMRTIFAATSPEFFLHHSMIDSIWFEYQKKCKECVVGGFNNTRLLAYKPIQFLQDYLDSSNLGGCGLQVTYEADLFQTTKKNQVDEDLEDLDMMNYSEEDTLKDEKDTITKYDDIL